MIGLTGPFRPLRLAHTPGKPGLPSHTLLRLGPADLELDIRPRLHHVGGPEGEITDQRKLNGEFTGYRNLVQWGFLRTHGGWR